MKFQGLVCMMFSLSVSSSPLSCTINLSTFQLGTLAIRMVPCWLMSTEPTKMTIRS